MSYQDTFALRETIAVYNDVKFAGMYFSRWGTDLPRKHLDAFSGLIGSFGTILDAGCGPGHHSSYLYKLGHLVIGIDMSHASLKLAKNYFPGPLFVEMDMLSTGFTNSIFDGIWACASVMHLPHNCLEPQLLEFNRLLCDRGILSLTMALNGTAHKDAFGRFFEAYSTADITDALAISGFEMLQKDVRTREKNTEQNGEKANWVTINSIKIK